MPADHFLTDAHKVRFIELLRTTGNPSVAARAIGFAPSTLRRHKDEDAAFAEEWADALDEAADALEAEARRRALDGVTREKYIGTKDNGRFIEELHYSDTLLVRLLEANKPDKFANRSKTELSNPDGSMTPALGDTEVAARLASLLALAEARMKEQG